MESEVFGEVHEFLPHSRGELGTVPANIGKEDTPEQSRVSSSILVRLTFPTWILILINAAEDVQCILNQVLVIP